ncbi:MAG TPA: MotA/TolQ/ExbB proton channel family protein [Candidatus Spyradosoma merdigallinarum]|uniref:MotA/TolQ/ExbB proton channel family protein n=1 Tax=Candidatus Spyradosoma merdigallinarum TaxID=2840950 RepID=A0A9D1NKF0_9BACT|nr:MotA/TolQ/ExbB proton channel family protein [Candidatus Spyradosoma merdigallinarum]
MDFSKDISDMAGGNAGPEFSLVLSGGPFVWLLLAIGFIGLLIIVERVIYLHRGQIRAMAFVEGVCANLRNGRFLEALTVCEESPGPVPRVVKVILLHAKEGEARMRIAAEEAALLEIPVLERRAGTIRALAKIAPLVGLAGTVFAILRAFLAMRAAGHYASADAFAGDIASALAATGVGLCLAAVFHFGYHFVRGRIRSISSDIERSAVAMIRFICYEKDAHADEDE